MNDQKDIEKINLDALDSFSIKSEENKVQNPNLHTYSDHKKITYYDKETPMSVGAWLILFIVEGIISIIPMVGPIITLIITLILAFSQGINKNLQNFARAMLILSLVILILVVIFFESFKKYLTGF